MAPPATEEEDEVEEIEREESRPQAVRIIRKWGNKVVVVEEEDTTKELRRLESTLSTMMQQIKVKVASSIFMFVIGDLEFFIILLLLQGIARTIEQRR